MSVDAGTGPAGYFAGTDRPPEHDGAGLNQRPDGVLADVHRYGALREPGPVGQREQPVLQLLIREYGRVK